MELVYKRLRGPFVAFLVIRGLAENRRGGFSRVTPNSRWFKVHGFAGWFKIQGFAGDARRLPVRWVSGTGGEPHEWGRAFKLLLAERGVRRGKGGDRKSNAAVALDTIESVAGELGVPIDTAKKRLRLADDYQLFAEDEQRAIHEGETTIKKTKAELGRFCNSGEKKTLDNPLEMSIMQMLELFRQMDKTMFQKSHNRRQPWAYRENARVLIQCPNNDCRRLRLFCCANGSRGGKVDYDDTKTKRQAYPEGPTCPAGRAEVSTSVFLPD